MELKIGNESRQEYLSFELAGAARKLVEQIMLAKPGENLVITADTATDWRVVEATAKAAYVAGAVPVVMWYETRPATVIEPPLPVAVAVTRADVWIEFAYACVLHTPAFRAAMAAGTRYICLTGMDTEMMVKTIGRVNYPKLVALGETIRQLVEAADEVRVTSPSGTDILAYNRGRRVRQSGKLADTKGEPIMLGGQVSWCPVEETINGRLVFDGALWPPMELGILRSPVALTLEKGVVTKVEGGTEAQVFDRWLKSLNDEKMYWLAHYSIGFNPGVTSPTGRIVEDERVFGCVEMGIGSQGAQIRGKTWSAASHTDGIVLNPTIILDGVVVEKDGVYVHPKLVGACRELGVPGY
jgi:leucyl aminopeptidase (aminopeptidase T)